MYWKNSGSGQPGEYEKNSMKKHGKLLVYLLGYLILAILLAVFQPIWDPEGQTNPPDESVRFLVPRYVYAHGEIPTGLEEEIRIPGKKLCDLRKGFFLRNLPF